jgi:hypothetical protein
MKKLINILILTFLTFNLSIAEVENFTSVVVERIDVEILETLDSAEVYPNPADDHVFLRIKNTESFSEIKIEVMSIIGTKMQVTSDKMDARLYKIDLSNIPVGHYYMLLTVDSKKSLKKFLKK